MTDRPRSESGLTFRHSIYHDLLLVGMASYFYDRLARGTTRAYGGQIHRH